MKKSDPLYFIAIVPPEPELTELWGLKHEFAEKYSVKAALKSPPHVTLHMPFRYREDREPRLFETLQESMKELPGFRLVLDGFGSFPPRVVYLQVEENSTLNELYRMIMKLMKTEFSIFNAGYKDRPFHPHLTLAFRDVRKAVFNEIWEHVRNEPFRMEADISHVCLLKHNGSNWEVYRQFPLKAS